MCFNTGQAFGLKATDYDPWAQLVQQRADLVGLALEWEVHLVVPICTFLGVVGRIDIEIGLQFLVEGTS